MDLYDIEPFLLDDFLKKGPAIRLANVVIRIVFGIVRTIQRREEKNTQ
jgi:hypothetical protein